MVDEGDLLGWFHLGPRRGTGQSQQKQAEGANQAECNHDRQIFVKFDNGGHPSPTAGFSAGKRAGKDKLPSQPRQP
jgi:hypothetical protein